MSGENIVLVTGFGPFGSHKVNASWVAVQRMLKVHEERRQANENSHYFKLEAREVPVSYAYVTENLGKIYEETSPALCVHVGVSPYAYVKMERIGRNFGYFSPDVEGKVPPNGFCKDNGDLELETLIDLDSVCEELAATDTMGVKIGISDYAGQYLCDFIYYSSLHLGKCPVVFVHVPPLDDPYNSEQLGFALLQLVNKLVKILGNK